MKTKLILLLVFVSICSLLTSTTFIIKQDGTGNFTTIQEGIIATTDNDTVLVYPGIYYENIDYLEKSLTVASLYLITPEDSLINQTIIDGNQQGRCVKIDECENASIIGFTLQNGHALEIGVAESYQGGGIFIEEVTNIIVSNCNIKNNRAYDGGGFYIADSNILLKGNSISNNWGIRSGGAFVTLGTYTTTVFDSVDLNSIYLNYSCTGADIYNYSTTDFDIIVDTFTVSEPDYFYIASNNFHTVLINNAKIEEIDQDLFVDPDGDDNNSGLTSDDPFQTIAWAQTIIKRNDENPHTIHLAEGIYSSSSNNQRFPVGIKNGIKYLGVSSDTTILDGENQNQIICSHFSPEAELPVLHIENVKLSNASNIGDSYGAIFTLKAEINLNNVVINNCYGDIGSAIKCRDGIYDFKNLKIFDNNGGVPIRISCIYYNLNPVLQVNIENALIQNNYPGQGETAGSGGGLHFYGHSEIIGDYYVSMINCDVNSNYCNFYNPQTGLGGASGLYMGNNIVVDIINCTFGNNALSATTGCLISVVNNSELNLYNTILYNNDGYSFTLWENAVVNVSHSLIEGGDGNVHYYYPLAIVNWNEGNLDEDPYWDVTGDYPYALMGNSPCINAGTLDLPEGIELPEYDLAGNPRIYGDTIDMGAYEFQGDPQSNDENEIVIPETTLISNNPNPFNPSTTIKLDLAESGKIELVIYNIKGQKVKTLMDAYSTKGHFEIIWRGTDDDKRSVASGQYFIKLKVNGEEKAVSKCMLLK